MNSLFKYTLGLTVAISAALSSCSEFEPTGYEEIPNLPTAMNIQATAKGRAIDVTWELPDAANITDVLFIRDARAANAISLGPSATSYTVRGQQPGVEGLFTVKICYDDKYVSEGISTSFIIPDDPSAFNLKMGYLMTAPSIADLPDDDEQAAASWFVQQANAELISPSDIATLDPDICPVLWIEIDRVGLPMGWENLPSEVSSPEVIEALKQYSQNGGSLYLANFATQLTVPLGFVPENMAPTVYGNGEGGSGDDVWVINPFLGVDFKDGGDQGYYDRSAHDIFKGLTLEDPNGYGYLNLPLIGPGQREDHNCLWDCNIYGKGNYADVIANFEATTGSLVLATWGHVRDHCVAGLVEFYATPEHGRCIANGFAAYEWNQNSGPNPYMNNIEKLTLNILQYLK